MKSSISVFTVSYTFDSGGIKENYVISIENPSSLDELLTVVEGAFRAVGYEHEFKKRITGVDIESPQSQDEYDLDE
jgi:hypothetical protein